MIPFQTSTGSNGKQNVLFPLEYMFITQGENGGYSHQGIYALDCQGWGENGRVYQCPYYAPCDIVCVVRNSDTVVWNSREQVNLIDGRVTKVFFLVAHDDNTSAHDVGDTLNQGELMGHTGTAGDVTGDHVHMAFGIGEYDGMYINQYGVWDVRNGDHIYNMCGVNNTNLYRPLTYDWREYSDIPPKEINKFMVLLNCGVLDSYNRRRHGGI